MLYLMALMLGAAGAFCVSKWGPAVGLIDHPSHRGSHAKPTPKGGGIGILFAFGLAAIQQGFPVGFWVAISVVGLVGLYNDKVALSARVRLLIQFAAAVCLIANAHIQTPFILLPIWVIFIIGTANCYNFMDGINGIAAITGVVGFGLTAYFGTYVVPNSTLSTLSVCILLACLAFLPFNMPRALVFMGDVGSVLLGILYGSLVFLNANTLADFLCFVSFMFPFYADEVLTKLVQIKEGDSLTRPHRKHVYQLMANEMRIAHWKISLGYGGAQLFVGITMLWLRPAGWEVLLLALVGYFLVFVVINRTIRKRYRWQV